MSRFPQITESWNALKAETKEQLYHKGNVWEIIALMVLGSVAFLTANCLGYYERIGSNWGRLISIGNSKIYYWQWVLFFISPLLFYILIFRFSTSIKQFVLLTTIWLSIFYSIFSLVEINEYKYIRSQTDSIGHYNAIIIPMTFYHIRVLFFITLPIELAIFLNIKSLNRYKIFAVCLILTILYYFLFLNNTIFDRLFFNMDLPNVLPFGIIGWVVFCYLFFSLPGQQKKLNAIFSREKMGHYFRNKFVLSYTILSYLIVLVGLFGLKYLDDKLIDAYSKNFALSEKPVNLVNGRDILNKLSFDTKFINFIEKSPLLRKSKERFDYSENLYTKHEIMLIREALYKYAPYINVFTDSVNSDYFRQHPTNQPKRYDNHYEFPTVDLLIVRGIVNIQKSNLAEALSDIDLVLKFTKLQNNDDSANDFHHLFNIYTNSKAWKLIVYYYNECRKNKNGSSDFLLWLNKSSNKLRLKIPYDYLNVTDPSYWSIIPHYRYTAGLGNWSTQQSETATAQADLIHLAVLVDLYQAKYGQIPTELNQLVPEFIMKVPFDPTKDVEYRYKITDTHFMLYRPGFDKFDSEYAKVQYDILPLSIEQIEKPTVLDNPIIE